MRPGIDKLRRLLQKFFKDGQRMPYFWWEQMTKRVVEGDFFSLKLDLLC